MVEKEQERKTKEEEKAKKVVKMDRNFGRWEHGTKGFGSKILAKFGFEGRLGKNSSGISKPIEVVRRKDGAGLGAVAEASSVNRENNMHLFGKDSVVDKTKGDQKKRQRNEGNSNAVRPMWQKRYANKGHDTKNTNKSKNRNNNSSNNNSNNNNSNNKQKDPRIRSARDVIDYDAGPKVKPTAIETILDMRGSSKGRLVNSISEALSSQGIDYEDNEDEEANAVEQGTHPAVDVGKEIKYNINKLKEMCEIDLHKWSSGLRSSEREQEKIQNEMVKLKTSQTTTKQQKKEMVQIQELLTSLQNHGDVALKEEDQVDEHGKQTNTSRSSSGPSFTRKTKAPASASSISEVLLMKWNTEGAHVLNVLLSAHVALFHTLKLVDLIEAYVKPMITKCLALHPYDCAHVHNVVVPWWRAMVNNNKNKNNNNFNNNKNNRRNQRIQLQREYKMVVSDCLRTVLNFDAFDIERPESLITLMEGIIHGRNSSSTTRHETGEGALPIVGRSIIVEEILPRIIHHLEHGWTYDVPCHLWIHPWLPMLMEVGRAQPKENATIGSNHSEVHIQSLLRPVKQQLMRWYLTGWASDSSSAPPSSEAALAVLVPWVSLLPPTMLDDVVETGIMPTLAKSIIDQVQVQHSEAALDLEQELRLWHPTLGTIRLAALLSAHFFPRWLLHLRTWLISAHNQQLKWENDVLGWYEKWTSALPLEVKEHSLIKRPIGVALSMLNTMTTLSTNKHKGGSDDSDDSDDSDGSDGGKTEVAVEQLLPKIQTATTFDRILLRMRRENSFNGHGNNTFEQPSGRRSVGVSSNNTSLGEDHGSNHGSSSGNIMSTYRDVVEMFAQENGVEFVPKLGRAYRGQPLYTLDGITCYLDRGVMYVRAGASGDGYKPMSLEDALQIGQERKNMPLKKKRKLNEKSDKMEVEEAEVEADLDDLD
tara:strand:- start:345 stop:3137 length:2793 start_codon:yes stop_codon:yes gene_type:complete